MANIEQQRERLINLLKALFQLDQPDLDFGFYRIMHARSAQVSDFLENDLLSIIREAFGEADDARIAERRERLKWVRQKAADDGVPEAAIEDYRPVREARQAFEAARETGDSEGDVYDHLYRFFERYYDQGDFMSRRYFARETDGKAVPYAIPYDGREVYLHWANRDQYYIKTSEYLTNFTFDPTQAPEYRAVHGALFEHRALKTHCRIIAASEGEHNNVKASGRTERYFIIHGEQPVKLETGQSGAAELVIQFEYRADPEKQGQEGAWRKKRLEEAAECVKAALGALDQAEDYAAALMTPAPTEKEKERTLLEKYIGKYAARNTMDYFIHKDLGGFLRRELDFYIKNEVMRLDDIEAADAPRVESYLSRIKVMRRIGRHLIDFLAQLENFQKKLWLKKKFVVDTQYCITLDRIPKAYYPEIAANEAQREEWVKLFAIDEMSDYSEPLTIDFLKANPFLVLDTAFFPEDIKDTILSALQGLDNSLNGILAHGDNFQALNLIREYYRGKIKCMYIDPPYNAKSSEIIYKNSYKHSSWLSLIKDRIETSKSLLSSSFVSVVAIDEIELNKLGILLEHTYSNCDVIPITIVHNPTGQQGNNFSASNDFAFFVFPSGRQMIGLENRNDKARDSKPDTRPLRNVSSGENHYRSSGVNCFYPIYIKDGNIIGFGDVCDKNFHPENINILRENNIIEVYPLDSSGNESKWVFARDSVESIKNELRAEYDKKKKMWDIMRTKSAFRYKTVWTDKRYSANSWGSAVLNNILSKNLFTFPKSLFTVMDTIDACLNNINIGFILDYFAGSGTTGHAVINLNREDGGKRKYILIEMADYFDKVLKPRIAKVIYSKNWKNGKPAARDTGISHFFKYIRLESYEDTQNNLILREAPVPKGAADFQRDYLLHYWLEFETRGSPSLLNIQDFADPAAYKLKVKTPGTDEYVEKAVDLVETFNWLIGLHVEHLDRWHCYDATFKREQDPELPEETDTRLILDGPFRETDSGAWRFRKIEGYTLRAPGDHADRERTLVIWRKLTGDMEKDNLMLDEWFKACLAGRDAGFDVIYVNGSNNLLNLRRAGETWQVRLTEEHFHRAMWEAED